MENSLTAYFMYGGDQPQMQLKCVPTSRQAIMTGDSIDDGRFKKLKTYQSYVVYVAYRLDPPGGITHHAKISQAKTSMLLSQGIPLKESLLFEAEDGVEPVRTPETGLQPRSQAESGASSPKKDSFFGLSPSPKKEPFPTSPFKEAAAIADANGVNGGGYMEVPNPESGTSKNGFLGNTTGTGTYDIEDVDDFEYKEEGDGFDAFGGYAMVSITKI